MATKIEIQNAISTALSVVITKAKVLLGLENLINEFYAVSVYDNQTTTNVLTPILPNLQYEITITKRGNNVNIYGSVRNNNVILIHGNLFQITDAEFYPNNTIETLISINANEVDKKIYLNTANNIIITYTGIGVSERIYFNFNYTTAE